MARGVTKSVNLIIGRKNWRSAWMLVEEANWLLIEQIFWKSTKQIKYFSHQAGNITADPPDELLLHNELYSLKKKDQEVLFSKQEWLKDRIMLAAQKLI